VIPHYVAATLLSTQSQRSSSLGRSKRLVGAAQLFTLAAIPYALKPTTLAIGQRRFQRAQHSDDLHVSVQN
jgi:hypothetical protein